MTTLNELRLLLRAAENMCTRPAEFLREIAERAHSLSEQYSREIEEKRPLQQSDLPLLYAAGEAYIIATSALRLLKLVTSEEEQQ